MSKTLRLSLALAAVAAWFSSSVVGLEAVEAPADAPQGKSAVLETYAGPGGEMYFAMKLSPRLRQPMLAAHDVVVLFDTSASQAGAYREKALAALEALLSGLEPRDRVALSAVDLNAVGLTSSFVAAGGAEMQQALDRLRRRVPLGSTDMGGAVRSAVAQFVEAGDTGRVRSVVYIGDGVTTARSIAAGRLHALIDSLVKARISVSSYAVGPLLNDPLLGALANHTGGMLVVDSDQGGNGNGQVNDDQADARRIGGFLATAADGAVVWPVSASYPDAFGEVFPGRVPPLRFDRDTVVLGTLAGADVRGELRMNAELAGQTVELAWPLAVAPPDDEYAYLGKLVEMARRDGGIGLPAVGAAGLAELRRTVQGDAQNLARLGQQALAGGNLDQAEKLAAEAARLDPENNEAAIVRGAVGKATLASQRRVARDLKLAQRPAVGDGAAPADDVTREAADGSLVDEIERNDRVFTGFIRTEVENTIKRARSMLGTNPEQAESELKLLLEKIAQSVELAPDVRAQLVARLEATLRTARRQAEDLAEREIRDEQIRAEQAAREQINRDLYIRETKVEQLMARFSALMDEERYRDAEAIADLAEEMEPNRAGLRTAELWSRMTGYKTDIYALRDQRHRGFVDMCYATETSHVPTSDEPPILYPDPEVWQTLTARRLKYKAVDLAKNSPAEQKIAAALTDKTEFDFTDQPLTDVIEYLKAKHDIEIQLDGKALEDASVGTDTTVTRTIKGITLRSALRLLLSDLDLTYVIKDEVLLITTTAEAENILSTKVYPVADLVIPIQFPAIGGGRGAFAVKDDLKLSGKKKPAEAGGAAGAKRPAGERPAAQRAPAGAMAPAAVGPVRRGAKRAKTAEPVRIDFAEGDDPEVKWNDLFAEHIKDKLPTDGVRQAARELMKAGKFDHVIALINAALRNKQGQPWMYEALGLAMQAAKRDSVEIERVLMSAIDFTEDPMDVMYIAHYMAKNGLEPRALKLFEQVSESAPNAAEPFIMGLRLARQLDDIDGIRWATVGILSQAWPAEHIEIWNSANLTASSMLDRLKKENRSEEAQEYQAQIDEALVRDCVVIVSWTGDADVDLFVEEPAGTICSFRNPRTTSGGILLGDAMARQEGLKSQGASEVYVCPKGFDGTYKLAVRRVWGKLTADQVSVRLIWHYKTDQERFQVKQLNLKDGDAVAAFDLKEGRRQEPLAQQQVANAVAGQLAVNQQILNQQLNALNDPRVLGSMLRGVNRGNGGVIVNPVNPFFVQGAVGYMPITSSFPKGAGMFVNSAVVSADRRYVRVNPIPFFVGVTQVNTFNFVTGAGGSSAGGGGGGGGVSSGNGGGF
ncbi:MAG TPA: VWA domain-containing protein [Pirellulales bacterium]|nr:VWA domain-containing protein [Pirellulales bacterium]